MTFLKVKVITDDLETHKIGDFLEEKGISSAYSVDIVRMNDIVYPKHN